MPALTADRFKEAEYVRHVFRITADNATTLEDVLKPEYFVHVASKLHNTDIIEVIPENESWFATLIVRACSRIHAKCEVLNYKSFGAAAAPVAEGPFLIQHKGTKAKWSIIRRSDKELIKDGFASKEEATKWVDDNGTDLLA